MRRHAKAIVAISALLLLNCALGAISASAAAPTVTIDAPSAVSYTSVHVTGKVDPADHDTYYSFETSSDGGASWSGFNYEGPLFSGLGQTEVGANLSGLAPATEYRVRLVANNFVDPEVISPEETFTTDPVSSPTVTISTPSQVTAGTAHFSGTIDPSAPEAAPTSPEVEAGFKVDWHFECTPECPGLGGGTLAADDSAHTVEVDASGLQPNTDYAVTLVAKNAGPQQTSAPESFKTAEQAPEVYPTATASVTTSSATLAAFVNPHNSTVTDCHFAYGPTAAYGQAVPCAQSPAGNELSRVSAAIGGLSPASGYHYRLFVTTSGGSVEGDDRGFATNPAPAPQGACANEPIRVLQESQYLPECRAFEQVTPTEKNSANVGLGKPAQSAIQPGAVAFTTSTGLPGGPTNLSVGYYRAKRGPAGWTTDFYDLPQENQGTSITEATRFISSDLTKSVSGTQSPLFGVAPGGTSVFVHDLESGSVSPVAEDPTNMRVEANRLFDSFLTVNYGPVFGATADFRHLVFETSAPLLGSGPSRPEVWEWDSGQLWRVGILPNGDLGPAGSSMFKGTSVSASQHRGWLSADGSRVFFTAPPAPGQQLGPIYVREDHTDTRLISYSHRTGDDPSIPVDDTEFVAGSSDGRFVFFQSGRPLTDDSAGQATRIYRYDLETDDLIKVAGESGELFSTGGKDVTRVSLDGERLYLSSQSALTPNAVPGGANFYIWDRGDLRLIAAVDGAKLDFAMSDDGRYMEFATSHSPTGYIGKSAACPDGAGESGPCSEIYAYDATTRQVTCLSCAPQGVDPGGTATTGLGPKDSVYTKRAVLNDGTYLFDTPTSLVPQDTNRKRDVYSWKDGQLSLLSSGVDRNDSRYLDASADGTDVYFATFGRLVAQDRDELRDIYTVRRDGGIASQNVAQGEIEGCNQEACQGGQATPAPAAAIGSSIVNGPVAPSSRKSNSHGRSSKLAVRSRAATANAATLAVTISGPGTIKAFGKGILTAIKKVGGAGTKTIKVRLTTAARKAKMKRARVKVTFIPRQGKSSSRRLEVSFGSKGSPR